MKLVSKISKVQGVKILMVVLSIGILTFAGVTYTTNQRIAHKQAVASEQAVANHTQTLNEINNAVIQLEKNNQVNHDTTIAYLKCIVQGLVSATPSNVQPVLNACLVVSGVPQ